MTIEPAYSSMSQDVKRKVKELYTDFRAGPFYARNNAEFDELTRLGVLQSVPGSTPNSPTEYRFIPEVLKELGIEEEKPVQEVSWEERPYKFNPEKSEGQIRKLVPHMERFIRYFGTNAFTTHDFTDFAEDLDIWSPSGLLTVMYHKGILSRLKAEKTQYKFTGTALEKFGD